jgi:hypothetical protein
MSRNGEEDAAFSFTDQVPSSSRSSQTGRLSAFALFPLQLLSLPSTNRCSGHRRRANHRAIVIYNMANAIIRGLNTLFFNFPSVSYAEGVRSTDPSLAQHRLITAIIDAAAAFIQASRRCLVQSTAAASDGGECGRTTSIPGCLIPAPRTRSGLSSSSPATPLQFGSDALFIFSDTVLSTTGLMPESGVSHPRLIDTFAAASDSHAGNSDDNPLHHVYQCFDSIALPSEVGADRTYADALPVGIVPLRCSEVSLPSDLNNVPLLSLLPSPLASLYDAATSLLLPQSVAVTNLATADLRKPRVFAERSEYIALVKRMAHLGMLSMTVSPRCINGLFGTPKGDGFTRLILDARPANCYFVRPPKVKLPSPSHLAALRVPHRKPLFVAKLDLSNFYHQLALPEWIRTYFALPAITTEELGGMELTGLPAAIREAMMAGQSVYPCCATLPMGFSHSVFIAQAVHEHILYRDGVLRPSDNIVALTSPMMDRPLHGLYIDDTALVGTDRGELMLLYNQVMDAYHAARLPPKLSKCQPPTQEPVTVLGMDVDGRRGIISLSMTKYSTVLTATVSLLSQSVVSGKQLSAVVGSWTWPMLLRRPLLAVFKHVYKFVIKYPDERRPLWPSARRELLTVVALAPLMRCNLRRQNWTKLLATDASMQGTGMVSTRLTPSLLSALWPGMIHHDCSLLPSVTVPASSSRQSGQLEWPSLSALQPIMEHRRTHVDTAQVQHTASRLISSSVWSTVIARPWRYQQHINELELQSLITSVRWALSHPNATHSQLLVLVDSSTAHYGVAKGRSGSPHLLSLLRRYSALVLAGDVAVLSGWVPSALNPADDASRKYRDMLPNPGCPSYV